LRGGLSGRPDEQKKPPFEGRIDDWTGCAKKSSIRWGGASKKKPHFFRQKSSIHLLRPYRTGCAKRKTTTAEILVPNKHSGGAFSSPYIYIRTGQNHNRRRKSKSFRRCARGTDVQNHKPMIIGFGFLLPKLHPNHFEVRWVRAPSKSFRGGMSNDINEMHNVQYSTVAKPI
jgi:hypothetical protein